MRCTVGAACRLAWVHLMKQMHQTRVRLRRCCWMRTNARRRASTAFTWWVASRLRGGGGFGCMAAGCVPWVAAVLLQTVQHTWKDKGSLICSTGQQYAEYG